MDKKRIKVIMPFIEKVKKKYAPEEIILFGSQARGDYTSESDFDVLVVSTKFKKINFYERAVALYHLKRGVPAAMDILCYTPEEFEEKKKRIGVVQQAVKEGIEL